MKISRLFTLAAVTLALAIGAAAQPMPSPGDPAKPPRKPAEPAKPKKPSPPAKSADEKKKKADAAKKKAGAKKAEPKKAQPKVYTTGPRELRDKDGNVIPTSPDAYNVDSAMPPKPRK